MDTSPPEARWGELFAGATQNRILDYVILLP
jgi:hypothetical protein